MVSLMVAGGRSSRGRTSVHVLLNLARSQGNIEPCIALGRNPKCCYRRKVSMRLALRQFARCVYGVPLLRPGTMCVRMARSQGLQKAPEPGSVLCRVVVLLLMLVCMTTGCARSTAQPQTSSPSLKQSTPPRSKARAPVTTVRPKAPPQPAQPQQEEEQGGRVF